MIKFATEQTYPSDNGSIIKIVCY